MLSIVATPIGNLGDITLRAIETLKTCDAIVCEDTRVTGNLLKQLGLSKKELISFHSHTHLQKIEGILERLAKGQHIALVSDAGTPGISDPGYAIVSRIAQPLCGTGWCGAQADTVWNGAIRSAGRCGSDSSDKRVLPRSTETKSNFHITTIPGPSAFLAAISASGLPINQFLYLGFLPIKKGRQTLLRSLPIE